MFKSDIVAVAMATLFVTFGGFLAIQPVTDPGYVHPVALILTGVGMAVIGCMFSGAVLAMNALDRQAARAYASGRRDEFAMSAPIAAIRERETYGYAPFGA